MGEQNFWVSLKINLRVLLTMKFKENEVKSGPTVRK